MSEPLRWPNNCQAARDRAAELLVEVVQALKPLVDEVPLPPEASYRRTVKAMTSAQDALRWLESVGARTRPVE